VEGRGRKGSWKGRKMEQGRVEREKEEGRDGFPPKKLNFPRILRSVDKSLIFHAYIFGQ